MKNKDGRLPFDLRECPAPLDDSQKLITHKVDPETCRRRQERDYHKCFCCKWRGRGAEASRSAAAGEH